MYASYVHQNGSLTQITIGDSNLGAITGTAINSSGKGIIGGYFYIDPNFLPYVAFVTFGNTTPDVIDLELSQGVIFAASINDEGTALVGGSAEGGDTIYAALITDSTVTSLLESSSAGTIGSVSINEAGSGIIGGSKFVQNEPNTMYAALVDRNGNLTPLFGENPPNGDIQSVSINNNGVGLIGGITEGVGYAAFVAPNGALTEIDMSGVQGIYAVAIFGDGGGTNSITPKSAGSLNSPVYTQLAASQTLQNRFVDQNKSIQMGETVELARLAGLNTVFASTNVELAEQVKVAGAKNSIWVAPFGSMIHMAPEDGMSGLKNTIGGALLAYDHQDRNYMVGLGVGYGYNYVQYGGGKGHGNIQEEVATLYGSYYQDHFWVASALWGGLYQFSNTRYAPFSITAKSRTHGWILSPHFEMATPWAISKNHLCFIEPFVMLDWVNNWQHGYTETGPSGFNLQVGSLYGSLLQSEAGLRFYERFLFASGDFLLEEKVSYINQAPFFKGTTTTAFVASASSFPVAVASTKIQNLASIQLLGSFQPKNKKYPYAGFVGQVSGGPNYQMYYVSLFLGKDF